MSLRILYNIDKGERGKTSNTMVSVKNVPNNRKCISSFCNCLSEWRIIVVTNCVNKGRGIDLKSTFYNLERFWQPKKYVMHSSVTISYNATYDDCVIYRSNLNLAKKSIPFSCHPYSNAQMERYSSSNIFLPMENTNVRLTSIWPQFTLKTNKRDYLVLILHCRPLTVHASIILHSAHRMSKGRVLRFGACASDDVSAVKLIGIGPIRSE